MKNAKQQKCSMWSTISIESTIYIKLRKIHFQQCMGLFRFVSFLLFMCDDDQCIYHVSLWKANSVLLHYAFDSISFNEKSKRKTKPHKIGINRTKKLIYSHSSKEIETKGNEKKNQKEF